MNIRNKLSIGLVAALAILAGVTSVRADYSAIVLNDNPIHFWVLGESSTNQPAADIGTPGGNPGTYTDLNNVNGLLLGQPTTPALIGDTCASFDGLNGVFVDVGLFYPGASVTVEAWVKVGVGAVGNIRSIIARWDGCFELDVDGNNYGRFIVRNDTNGIATVSSLIPLIPGQWHHVVGVFENGVVSVYRDSVLGGTNALGGSLQNVGPSPDRVLIGNTRTGSTGNVWIGDIAKVAVYNYGLTPQQVLTHYTGGVPGVAPVLTQQPALTIRWPSLPGNYSLQAADSLSNPNWTSTAATPVLTPDATAFEQVIPTASAGQFYRTVSTNAIQP